MTAFLRFRGGVIHGDQVMWDDSGGGWPPEEFITVVYGPMSGMRQFVKDDWRELTDVAAAVESGALLHTRYKRDNYSKIEDGAAAEMSHVIRGAEYVAYEGQLEPPNTTKPAIVHEPRYL